MTADLGPLGKLFSVYFPAFKNESVKLGKSQSVRQRRSLKYVMEIPKIEKCAGVRSFSIILGCILLKALSYTQMPSNCADHWLESV